MRRLLILLALLGPALPAAAQTPVRAGAPVTVTWDASPAAEAVTAYRCYLDTAKVGADIPASGPRTCTTPVLTAGNHTIEVSAVNAFGEGARASLPVTAGSPPGAPLNLRIVVQVAVTPDGAVQLLAASAEAVPPPQP